jgi:hypothetical protein
MQFLNVESLTAQILPALTELVTALVGQVAQGNLGKLRDLSRAVLGQRNQLTAKILQVVVERCYDSQIWQHKACCPQCNRRLFRKRRAAKEVSTLVGSFVLRRPYFYCSHCRLGFCPLDAIVEMAPEYHQYDVQAEVVRTAADVTYTKASEHFTRLTGIKAEVDFIHQTLNRVVEWAGPEDVLPSREEIERRIAQAQVEQSKLPVLVVSADGAHAKIRAPQEGRAHKRGQGSWQEVKGFRAYLLGADKRIVALASWHQRGDCPSTAEALRVLAARIPTDKVRVMIIGDGASWVWNLLRAAFPAATEVLDRYHCKEYLRTVAKIQFEDESDARHWVETIMARLDAGDEESAFEEILDLVPVSSESANKIELCVAYLGEHVDRFDYDRRKKQGFAIGSGAMESANRYILHDRLKKPGAWWLDGYCNTMLRVRCAIYNGTFDSVFEAYVQEPPPRVVRRPPYDPNETDEPTNAAA